MKRLIVLIILLLPNYSSFSQTDTSKVCYSYNVAKLVAIDLLKGDSARAELDLTQKLVIQLEEKISHQDTLIKNLKSSKINFQKQVDGYQSKTLKQDSLISKLKQDVVDLDIKYQRNKRISQITGGSVLILIIYNIFMIKP